MKILSLNLGTLIRKHIHGMDSQPASSRLFFDMKKIIIYDGDCGICSKSVNLAMKHNSKLIAYPYQNKEFLDEFEINSAEAAIAVHFINGGEVFKGAEAVSKILKEMAGIWALIGFAIGLPAINIISEYFYKIISKYRRKISIFLGLKACKI